MFLTHTKGPVTYARCGTERYPAGFYHLEDTLIDCGPPRNGRDLKRFLTGNPVKQALLTHHHEDHSGNTGLLNRNNIVPLIHKEGVDFLNGSFPVQPLFRRYLWGKPAAAEVSPLEEFVRVGSYRFMVLHTPGHSVDHVCFYEPDKQWLFSGDLFISRQIKYLWNYEDLDAIIASIVSLLELRVDTLFCPHVGPIEDGSYFLRERLEYILAMRDTVRGLSGRGMDVAAIQNRLQMNDRWISWLTGGNCSSRNLISALISSKETAHGSLSVP